jgi:hypothetical protein
MNEWRYTDVINSCRDLWQFGQDETSGGCCAIILLLGFAGFISFCFIAALLGV